MFNIHPHKLFKVFMLKSCIQWPMLAYILHKEQTRESKFDFKSSIQVLPFGTFPSKAGVSKEVVKENS